MAEADTPLLIDAEIAQRLAGHIEFYVRDEPGVSWEDIDDRGDRSHPGPPLMRYSPEALTRSFYVPDGGSGKDYQCGWDMLVEMDRPFEVAVSRTDNSIGAPGDFLVLEYQSHKLVPWGVITRDEARAHLTRIDPTGPSSRNLNVFYSYKKSDDAEQFAQAQKTLERWMTGVTNAYRGNHDLFGRFNLKQWWDNEIRPGDTWRDEIRRALVAADVVVVMIDRSWREAESFEFAKQNELELAKRHRAIGRCEILYFAVDVDLPQDLKHIQATRIDGRDGHQRVEELGHWSPTAVIECLASLVRERDVTPVLPLTHEDVLGPKPEARSRVSDEWSLDPEPITAPLLTVPTGPWCYVPDHGRMRIVTEVTPATDVPVLCSQAVVSDDGTLLLGVADDSTELVIVDLGAGWSARRPWRPDPQVESGAPLGPVELVSATRCGREFWLLWNRDGMLHRARLDREGIPWGERLVRSGPARSAAYLMAFERSPLPQLVAVSPDGAANDHPAEWGTALADLNIAGVEMAAQGCSLAAVAGADSSGDGVLRVLDITTGSVILEVRSTHRPFDAVRLAPDGSEVAGAIESRIYRWHITKDVDPPR